MWVKRLQAAGYRNFDFLEFSPSPGVNLIYGDNGQGKTNLIEAIWLFTGARSFRPVRESGLCGFGRDRASLTLEFYGGGRSQTAQLSLGAKRGVSLNGIELESAPKLAGSFMAVVFSPDHLALVKEGPAQRRRFLDVAICQLFPKYERVLADYNRILAQRGALLRDAAYNAGLLDMLEVWDAHFARAAFQLVQVRRRYVQRLCEKVQPIHSGLTGGAEPLEIAYKATVPGSEEEIRQLLKAHLAEDLRNQNTGLGPHRDDLLLTVAGQDARVYASQGQQRSVALALKLGEGDMVREIAGAQPVVLLDDVMSELDAGRRQYILNHIGESQVFITCCDCHYFTPAAAARAFEIKGGTVASVTEIAPGPADGIPPP